MSNTYPPVSQSTEPATDGAAAGAKEHASQLKDHAVEAGQQVGSTAKDEAVKVASEAKTQAKDLLDQAQSELTDQAATQQKRVASGMQAISADLSQMASKAEGGGVASDLVSQAASRAGDVATWLEQRDPGSLLSDVQTFARRRPGTFIAIAAVAGVLAGRLTRSVASAAHDESAAPTSAPSTATEPAAHPSFAAEPPHTDSQLADDFAEPVAQQTATSADALLDTRVSTTPLYDETPLHDESDNRESWQQGGNR